MELPAASHRPRIAAGLIFAIQAPRLPPPALAALGHPPPLREGGEKLEPFASPTQSRGLS